MLWMEQLQSLALRCGIFAFMLVAMLICGDLFPFSNFPMYSVLPSSLISMRLTNEKGDLLPSVQAFDVGTTIIKKQMARELHEMKDRGEVDRIQGAPLEVSQKAGQKVLNWLLDNHSVLDPKLVGATVKLEQTTYTASKGSITQKTEVIAEGKAKAPAKP